MADIRMPLTFSPQDILAFEEIHGSSGELHEIHVTLRDGSSLVFKELSEMCEILAVWKELKHRERTRPPGLPPKKS